MVAAPLLAAEGPAGMVALLGAHQRPMALAGAAVVVKRGAALAETDTSD